MASLKLVRLVKVYQYTTFHSPMFTGAIFAPTAEVWISNLEWLKLRD